MDQNVLSPEQLSRLQTFQYIPIQKVKDDQLGKANRDMSKVLDTMKLENQRLEKDVSTLQILVDSIFLKSTKRDPELKQEIKWDIYEYKKYTYQLHLLWVVIGACILLNLSLLLQSIVSITVVSIIAGVILGVTVLYLGYRLWDYRNRDDANFDEYNFYNYTGSKNRSNADKDKEADSNKDNPKSDCVIKPTSRYINL